MPRMYSAIFGAPSPVAVAAKQDLFSIIPGDDNPIVIHAVFLSQVEDDDVGDANEDIWGVALVRGHTTTGSGGSQPVARPLDLADSTGAHTATNLAANDTTTMTGGTGLVLHADAFNTRVGWAYIPTPEMRILVPGSVGFQVELVYTPASSTKMTGTLIWEEF